MTTQEFSIEFDILYDNINSNQAPGLTEYEKSVFLTKAQEELVASIYNGNASTNVSFDKVEVAKRYLDSLIRTSLITESLDENPNTLLETRYSLIFDLSNNDVWVITYEALRIVNREDIPVIPTTQDEYHRIKNNPFRGASPTRALRLDNGNSKVEIIVDETTKVLSPKYLVKYLSKPTPIILENLEEELTIDGLNEVTQCSLHPYLHRLILERAVELAMLSMGLKTK